MRYMMFYKPGHESDGNPNEDVHEALGRFIEELTESGTLLAVEGLQSSAHGARVRCVADGLRVTDGPFVQSKDVIGGFAILETRSKFEAIRIAKNFLKVMGHGESEIRLMEHDDVPAFYCHSEAALRASLLEARF